jgi:hypothetical protein
VLGVENARSLSERLAVAGAQHQGRFFCSPYLQNDPLRASLNRQPEIKQLLRVAQQRHETFKWTFADKL